MEDEDDKNKYPFSCAYVNKIRSFVPSVHVVVFVAVFGSCFSLRHSPLAWLDDDESQVVVCCG